MNIRVVSRGLVHVARATRGPSHVGQLSNLRTQFLRSEIRPFSQSSIIFNKAVNVGATDNMSKNQDNKEGNEKKDSKEDPKEDPKKAKGIKALVQKYGWVALGVYLSLSTIDLPICWLGVHSVGLDKVVEWQAYLKEMVGWKTTPKEELEEDHVEGNELAETVTGALAMVTPDLDLEAAVEQQKVNEKLPEVAPTESYWFSKQMWAEFAVAYAIHKSLIFIRLPITAAITPSVVKVLKRWGFKIGQKKPAGKFGTSPSQRQKWWSWWF